MTEVAPMNGGGDGPGGLAAVPEETNGGPLSEEELERQRMRPADVDADMREMARRKRVDAILSSPMFRMELDRLVEHGIRQGNCAGGSQISDVLGMVRAGPTIGNNGQHVQPIADLRGAEAAQMSKVEKMLRCKLAALCRVMDMFGWASGVCAHITVRISQDLEHFLVNPHGLLYSEITAASLLKADMQGNVVSAAGAPLGLGATYAQHAAIHAARPDLRCVLHVRAPAVVSVSALRMGLLPLTEAACLLGEVAVHRPGPADEPDALHRLTRDLGVHNKVLLMQSRGALCCGETVEEAFFLLSHLVAACENQVMMLPLGLDNLSLVDEQQRQYVYEEARRPAAASAASGAGDQERPRHQWRLGELEFEALMRVMDNAGFRTGHVYRHALRAEPPAHQSDVEYPPAASSHSADPDDLFKYSPMRRMFATKGTDRTRWLNSPNVYQKVEVLETGTSNPKSITKWVPDGSPSHVNTAIKVDAALQFVPKNTDPREFKQLQQQIKENRRGGGVSAGPQSHILEGVSWDEARQLQEAAEQRAGADQVVLVGAASKGIIQRNYQHNATVYKTPYAKNPFDQVTDEDLEEYRRFVDQKSRGTSVETERTEPMEPPPQVVAQAPLPPVPAVHQRQHPVSPQHAERVQLPSDGEDADVSHASAAPAFTTSTTESAGCAVPSVPPRAPRVDRVTKTEVPRPAPPPRTVTLLPDGNVLVPAGDLTANGDETDTGHMSTVSQTDQEDVSTSEATSHKDKKKKKGLRTPSFLKRKKDKKKDKKEDASK